MLQAHSILWNYLWVAPNVLLLAFAGFLWRRGLRRDFPALLGFSILSSVGQIAVFTADVVPSVSPENFWRIHWASLLIESLLKFALIGEIFSRVFNSYPSISKLGRTLVTGLGSALVLVSGLAAAFSRGDSTVGLISGAHLLEQTVFIIAAGLILFVFAFAAYFRLSWDRLSLGVLLGLGISACVHLATWAVIANGSPSAHERTLFAFLNMGTYHVCVLIWFYYLLVPQKASKNKHVSLPENNLDVWNQELERLLHQ